LLIPVLIAGGIDLAFNALAPAEAPAEITIGYLQRSQHKSALSLTAVPAAIDGIAGAERRQ